MSIFNKNIDNIILELADCIVRLDYWLSKNKKKNSREKYYNDGKLYAYAYSLMRLGEAKFWHPLAAKSEEDYIPIMEFGFHIENTDEDINIFIKKDLFNKTLSLNSEQLQKDILELRAKRK